MTENRRVVDLRNVCRKATEWETFYLEWGRETLKHIAPALDERFQKLITLNAALIAGAAIWVKEDIAPSFWRFTFIGCVALSLVCALLGVFPRGRTINYNVPSEIRDAEFYAVRQKVRCWWPLWRGSWA